MNNGFQGLRQELAEIQESVDALAHTLDEQDENPEVEVKHILKAIDLDFLAAQFPSIEPHSVALRCVHIRYLANSVPYSLSMDIAVENGLRKGSYDRIAIDILAALFRSKRTHHRLMSESKEDKRMQFLIDYNLRMRVYHAQARLHDVIKQAFGEPGTKGAANTESKKIVYALALEAAPYIAKILG